MTGKKGISKVGFEKLQDGSIKVLYFNDKGDIAYKGWTLPLYVVKGLTSWWNKSNKEKGIHPFMKEKSAICEYRMRTANYIEIEEYINPSHHKINFWTLSIDTAEELVNWVDTKR